MLNSATYTLSPEIESAVIEQLDRLQDQNVIPRIWQKDAGVWTGSGEEKWLGWLGIIDEELAGLQKYSDLRKDIDEAGFDDILLMGMGGSSLCPEVLALSFGKENFHILDSTVPARIETIEDELDLTKTLFIVASKSGSTLEPNCFKQYFYGRLCDLVGADKAGSHFIAVTDPGSKMEQIAREDGFRHIFYGKPEIGGRFSALSAFGLVAAASMGIEPENLLKRAREMAEDCRAENTTENSGALLGTVLGVCHRLGRDKLTIFASPEIYDLGAWLEQLLAESTGKNGKAIIPVDREPVLSPDQYGDDRVFVNLTLKGGRTEDDVHYALQEIERAGHPVISIELESLYHLGQEFFRWEFATAVAGSIMGINPFDQPDVESAKVEARKLTDEYEQAGKLPDEAPFYEEDGIKLFSGGDYAEELTGLVEEESLAGYLEAHLWNLEDGDYFAILAYLEMDPVNENFVQSLRAKVLEQHTAATCVGFGPRFLHSTGQAYKGGPNTGVFLQITADDEIDFPIPGQKYTFGVVKAAQARGDFQVLIDRGRRALRIDLGEDIEAGRQKLLEAIDHTGDVSI